MPANWLARDLPLSTRSVRGLLLCLFLASGFAGLVYQSIWSHYLALLLGHAAYAQALVLATFMGGMGLGAAAVAARGHRWSNLIRGYAIVELLLGCAGVGFHFLFVVLYDATLEQWLPALGGGSGATGLKWMLGVLLVLPQCILLGASFPLLSAGLMRRVPGAAGHILGSLYFTNSMGGALGALALAATFVLLPAVGTPGALQFAGLVNLLVGVAAWLLGRDATRADGATSAAPDSAAAGHRAGRQALLVMLLAASFLSSAASFVYEIAWIRMLSLAVGTTLHAFELMLAAFIGGMALGGLWIRKRIDHGAAPLVRLAWVQLVMGLCALLSLAVYAGAAFEWVRLLVDILPASDAGYAMYNAGVALAAIAVMLPAAFFAGATLPLFTTVLLRSGRGEGMIGTVYACNTFGAILGVMAGIHLLIPLLGLRDAMIVAAGVDIAIGCILLVFAGEAGSRRRAWPAAVGLGLLALATSAGTIDFDPYRLASGVFRDGAASLDRDGEMLYYEDGKTASVSLFQWPGGIRTLAYNGKVDASMQMDPAERPSFDEATNVLAAALPLGLHEAPAHAAVIGIGSGLTAHAMLADDRVERLQTIEIERRMVEASRGFGERVARVHEDPRSQIIIDDARSVLVRGGDAHDVIISIPSNPWVAGVGTLFADEFYDFIDQRLADDGLFVQWLQLYEINDALVGSMLSALTPHFAHTRAWMVNSADMLIVAGNGERLPALDTEHLFSGELGAELRRAGIDDPARIRVREIATDGMLPALAHALGQRPNSYYRPRLTLEAPRTRYRGVDAEGLRGLSTERSLALELLGAGAPLPAATAADSPARAVVERNTRSARALAELLRLGVQADADPADVTLGLEAELLRAWSSDCSALADRGRRDAWHRFHGSIAARVLPLVDAGGLQPLWTEREWLACDDIPADVSRALDFAAAAAARDLASLPARAADYLDAVAAGGAADNPLNEVAYLAGQAALMARGRQRDAEAFRLEYIGMVRPGRTDEIVQGILDRLRDLSIEPPAQSAP